MNDFQTSVSIPLDHDGFLRRECPACEREFKWFNHAEGDPDAEIANQYFCPLCGAAAGVDSWWTPAQLEYAKGMAAPAIEQTVQESIADAFKGLKGVTFKANKSFTMGIETPSPLIEPDDMVIVEPPCHPNEPIKVPEEAAARVHCLICGSEFAA